MHDPTTTSDAAPAAVTLEDLKRGRTIRARIAPSGMRYDLRPLNLERFALTGNLPARLRTLAMQGAEGVNQILGGDDEKVSEEGAEVQQWLDRLVAEVIVGPVLFAQNEDGTLHVGDDGQKVVDSDRVDLLPPIDYRWACAIALGECDVDGEGARLWGREPLSRWATFREHHSCDENCESCERVVDAFSATL